MIRTRNLLHDMQYQKKLKNKSPLSIRFDLYRKASSINVSMIFTFVLLFLLVVPRQHQRQYLFCSSTTSSSTSLSTTSYTHSNSNNDNKENIIYDNDDSSDNNYDYNIRTLDEYGNAKQLQYAMNAANQNGRLIVILTNMPSTSSRSTTSSRISSIAKNTNDTNNFTTSSSSLSTSSSSSSIWIISPIQPKHLSFMKYHRRHISNPSFISNINHNNIGIQQSNTSPSSSTATTSDMIDPTLLTPIIQSISKDSYIVATGINSDVQYMIQQLRIYYKYIYERYNSITQLSSKQLITIVQLLLHQFWNYPTIGNNKNNDDDDGNDNDSSSSGGSWVPMGYRQLMYENQQQSNNNNGWGRPMGICGIILYWNKQYQQYDMVQFDPTGCNAPNTLLLQQQQDRNDTPNITITCLGPKHELVHQELIKVQSDMNQYRKNHHNGDNISKLEQIILKAIERATHNNNNNDNYDDTSTSIKPKSSSSSLSSEPQHGQLLYQVEELCIPHSLKSTNIHEISNDEVVSSTTGTSSLLSSVSVVNTMMRIIQRH